jgi:hypothetical protein
MVEAPERKTARDGNASRYRIALGGRAAVSVAHHHAHLKECGTGESKIVAVRLALLA